MFDEAEIRKTISVMKPNGKIFEIRIIYDDKKIASGYFNDVDTMIAELKRQRKAGCNVYMTLNVINEACFSRSQRNKFEIYSKATTSDNDIVAYDWMMVDLDPKRPTGTSSSDEQIREAQNLGNKIYKFMSDVGFEKPLMAFSGNGVHLLYGIRLKNTNENKSLLEKCLKTLNMLFDNDKIGVDVKNYNPARVCKLYGTLAQKGSNTEKRPHRMSKIIGNPSEIKPTDIKYLDKLCGYYPQEVDKPHRYNNYNPKEFDLEEWMGKYSIRYDKSSYSDGMKYILECCPFDSNHKGKDACIFQSRSGAIGFNCFHNSCVGKTWKDVRMLYEPDAYEKRQEHQQKQMYQSFNRDKKPIEKHIEVKENIPLWYTAQDIIDMPKIAESFIKTGINGIDHRLRGLKKGYVSLWSGLRGSGKSSVLSQIILSACDNGNNVCAYSGELSQKNFMRWMMLQACGKSKVEQGKYEGYYNVPIHYQREIAKWLGDRFVLYNNEYGNDFKALLEQFEKVIEEKKIDFLILDNLMSFNISSLADNKWDAQTQFVWSLHELAQRNDVHIAFVAHPRKSLGFLRLDDISGSADLGNAVEDAFIVHRTNNDFKRLSAQTFGWKQSDPIYESTNVVEVCKDRDGGTQDLFVPLWYESETKRFKNDQTENVVYGWDDGSIDKEIEKLVNFEVEYEDAESNPFID